MFFLAGVLLSLTPCVLPMVPILSSIIVGQKERVSRGRGFALALAYSQGMALVYTALGVAAGLLGQGLAAYLQHPWVVLAFAALMVVLALSMFGLYELRLPVAVQSWLGEGTRHLPGGRFVSVFAMGVVSALIVSPCVSAPLAGALLYISQTRDVVLGGTALYAMAWGMSLPLLLVGLSAGSLLPRTGPWMTAVKAVFGVLMLGMALWVARPAWPYVQTQWLGQPAAVSSHQSVLPFERVRSVAELDAASDPRCYYEAGVLYFTVDSGGDGTAAKLYLDSATGFIAGGVTESCGQITLQNIDVRYGGVNTRPFRKTLLDGVAVHGSRINCWEHAGNSRFGMLEVSCGGSFTTDGTGDGVNGHFHANLIGDSLYAHDCNDDGESNQPRDDSERQDERRQRRQHHQRHRDDVALQARCGDPQALDGREHRDGRGDDAVAVEQRSAEDADDHQRGAQPGLVPHRRGGQRQHGDQPALAAVVGPQHQHHVLQRDDGGEGPENDGQHPIHVVVREGHMAGTEDFLDGVQHAGADIAIDHADGAQGERGQG